MEGVPRLPPEFVRYHGWKGIRGVLGKRRRWSWPKRWRSPRARCLRPNGATTTRLSTLRRYVEALGSKSSLASGTTAPGSTASERVHGTSHRSRGGGPPTLGEKRSPRGDEAVSATEKQFAFSRRGLRQPLRQRIEETLNGQRSSTHVLICRGSTEGSGYSFGSVGVRRRPALRGTTSSHASRRVEAARPVKSRARPAS